MEIGKYIETKIIEIKTMYPYQFWLNSYDSEIKHNWKKYLNNKDAEWSNINNNKDVFDLIDRFEGAVSFVENVVKKGHIIDSFNMALAFHKALTGLTKMSKFIDYEHYNQTKFDKITEEDVDKIFSRLESIAKRMNEQNLRRAMSD